MRWLVVVCCAALVALADARAPLRPRWPQTDFAMTFAWRMAFPDGTAASGPMLWHGNGSGAVAFNITALGFRQLQLGGTVWNWYSSTGDCFVWRVPYDLAVHWFENATAVDDGIGGVDADTLGRGATNGRVTSGSVDWVGTMATPGGPLGNAVPYLARLSTDPAPDRVAAVPVLYSAIGVLRGGVNRTVPGSEVMRRTSLVFAPQDPAVFALPAYCCGK